MHVLESAYEFGVRIHRAYHHVLCGQIFLPGNAEGLIRTISVGNFTWGGTGKTPFCAWIAERKGKNVTGILTRGYRGGDEADLLEAQGCLVGRGKDRFRSALKLFDESNKSIKYWVLDDGLQHWRIRRDVEIVTMDALRPFGTNGRLIPMGSLRERPEQALRRASAVIIHNSFLIDENEAYRLLNTVKQMVDNPSIPVVQSGSTINTAALKRLNDLSATQRKWILVSGLGNNEAFSKTIRRQLHHSERLDIRHLAFPDHHKFTVADLRRGLEGIPSNERILLTTEKDAARCPWLLNEPWCAQVVEINWELMRDTPDGAAFLELIDHVQMKCSIL